jgi:Rieske Fe-S protein
METPPDQPTPNTQPRRGFLHKFLAVIVGGVITTVPAIAGVLTFLNPLRKRNGATASDFIRVASLDAVPDDNLPHRFNVIADKVNAWTIERNVPIGSVYLKRKGSTIVAWNTSCPHLGCSVNANNDGSFSCPCHESNFSAEGKRDAKAVSPRDLDTLEIDQSALAQGEVRVKFHEFETGREAKVVRA